MKYAFMREHLRQFSVAAMSRVLKVSRSGFYDWCSRAPSVRHQANAKLLSHIRQIHLAQRQAYGAMKRAADPNAREEFAKKVMEQISVQ